MITSMLSRRLETDLRRKLATFPVVALLGPRQVGKTTLARKVVRDLPDSVYLDLERPSDLAKLADPELFLGGHSQGLVALDEVQRRPDLFPVLRALVDEDRRPGRFLVLGSAAPELLRQSAESLAGRIAFLELGPFTLDEVGATPEAMHRLWLRGGFPDSYLAADDRASLEWRLAFVQTFLERDLPQLGLRFPAPQVRRFWQMLAHHHGQLWNGAQLAGALGVSAPTVRHHLDVLAATFVVRELQPLHANLKKRLVKSPKVYIRDSGLLHALLGVTSRDDLLGHPGAGASWEGFALEQVLALHPGQDATFYRTAAGAELDLVLGPAGQRQAFEFKMGLAPTVTRGFWEGTKDLAVSRAQVVFPGEGRYPLAPGVDVAGLCDVVAAATQAQPTAR